MKVDWEIIDLILFAKELHRQTAGKTNIAMGAVLRIWHEYRESQGAMIQKQPRSPPMAELREAIQHTDINQVIVDEENSTVYLADRYMSLDVGAVAKGYAAELVMQEMAAQGLKSAMIRRRRQYPHSRETSRRHSGTVGCGHPGSAAVHIL